MRDMADVTKFPRATPNSMIRLWGGLKNTYIDKLRQKRQHHITSTLRSVAAVIQTNGGTTHNYVTVNSVLYFR